MKNDKFGYVIRDRHRSICTVTEIGTTGGSGAARAGRTHTGSQEGVYGCSLPVNSGATKGLSR